MKYLSVTSLLCLLSLNSLHASEFHGSESPQEHSQEMPGSSSTSLELSETEQAEYLVQEVQKNTTKKESLFNEIKLLLPNLTKRKKRIIKPHSNSN